MTSSGSGPGFRFLHASDFHLERCLSGLADDLPPAWESLVLSAPRQAAARVFELAIEHEVDAVLLAGDILDARLAGAPVADFLLRQFKRLERRDIRVYWVAGEAEQRGPWPAGVVLPANVTMVDGPQGRSIVHERNKRPVARIIARGADRLDRSTLEHLASGRDDLPRIGLAYGRTCKSDFRDARTWTYFALGGLHHPARVAGAPRRWEARYSGPPQAFNASNAGRRGCVLGEVAGSRRITTRWLPTEVLRWQFATIEAGPSATMDDVVELAAKRLDELQSSAGELHYLLHWVVAAEGDLGFQLRRTPTAGALLAKLRQAKRWPRCWSVSVDTRLTDSQRQRAEEDTILGEFLRVMNEYSQSLRELPAPSGWLPPGSLSRQMSELVDFATPRECRRLVRDVEALGYDLLRPPTGDAA